MSGPKYVSLVLTLLTAAASASSQQRAELPVLSIKTDLVSLSVTVVDRRGALVPGLRAEHFAVYDNG